MTQLTIGEGTLEYNAVRERLALPEYGRNIQNLVRHAKNIEDPDKRQWYVEMLIELMNQMLPGTKTSKEIEDKLWNHLFYIAEYELDVRVPETVTIHKKGEVFMIPSTDVGYPQKRIPYKHYGWNVHMMVEKALAMEEGPKRDEFARIIASYMKLAYRTWGKEQFVNDELIKQDLRNMSHGKLVVPPEANIDIYKNIVNAPLNTSYKRKGQKSSGGGQQQKQQSRHSSNNKQKKKKKH